MMLGATRPTVTVVAGTLQRAGLITITVGTSRSSIGQSSKPPPASVTRRRQICFAPPSPDQSPRPGQPVVSRCADG
jgi:hypothetical protein